MNVLPLHFAYLALSQLAPPAAFPLPAEVVPIQASDTQTAKNRTGDQVTPAEWSAVDPPQEAAASTVAGAAEGGESAPQSHVAPANGVSSLAPVSSADGVALAAMLIQESMNAVDPASFDGNATSLLAAIQHWADTGVRRQSVIAYWRLSAAISKHAFAEEEAAFLQRVVNSQQEDAQAMLEAAQAAAVARQHETAEAVALAQFDLVEQSYATASAALPWPDDTPLVGSYRTNFVSLFGDRTPPVRLRRIHRVLPATKRVIETRATAVVTARKVRDASDVSYQEGRLPMWFLLDASERLRGEQEAFLAAVLRYNESIAEYALAVVGPAADPATVVSTLIKWDGPPTSVVPIDQGVQPASAEEPLEVHAEQPARAATVAPPAAPPPLAPTTPSLDSDPHTQSVLRSIRIAH
ncbi:MAG: hypothetical protein ACC645_12455 [Pirellulales bacterium]